MKSIIPILFTFDQKLEIPAGVCITSLLSNANPDTFYDIFILHSPSCDFSDSKLNSLPAIFKNCRLTFRPVVNEFVGGYQIRGIPETAYYRLIAPELIPEYDKFLYSDVDVIFREDLGRYFKIDLGDCYFAGVDSLPVISNDDRNYLKKQLHFKAEKGYYYSGNLLINAELIKKDGIITRFRSLGKERFRYQDMDIINLVCQGRIRSIPPAFCLTTYYYKALITDSEMIARLYGEEEVHHALSSGIVHYNGAKPWQGPCPNADIWWAYYRKSIFFNESFCYSFWTEQRDSLLHMSLIKRLKHLLRYPLDRKEW